MILFLDTQGLLLTTRNGCLRIIHSKIDKQIGLNKITSIVVSSKINIESTALSLLFKTGIPVYFTNKFGAVVGVSRSIKFSLSSQIRRKQVLFLSTKEAVTWIIGIHLLKLEGQLANIKYSLDRKTKDQEKRNATLPKFEKLITNVTQLKPKKIDTLRPILLGKEGFAAKIYWKSIAASLNSEHKFNGRSQNPAKDPFNAALNYLYGILYTKVETAIYVAGLDATLGIFHSDQYQKPTLAFDLIEPFRPWADRFLIELYWQGHIKPKYFNITPEKTILNKAGKRVIIPAFLNFMDSKTTFNNQICTRNTHISRLAGALVSELLKI